MRMCFSGHRPNKLWGYEFDSEDNKLLRSIMKEKLIEIFEESEDDEFTMIIGMALGFDQFMFEVCLELRELYNLKIIAAVPFRDQHKAWKNQSDVERYLRYLKLADEVVYVDEIEGYDYSGVEKGRYHDTKLQARNMWMADEVDECTILWDGTTGGTNNFIGYARGKGKKLHIFHPKKLIPNPKEYNFR